MSKARELGGAAKEDRPHRIERLARTMRGSLASLRAAAAALERFPGVEAARRNDLHTVMREEAQQLGQLIDNLESLAIGAPTRGRELISAPDFLAEIATVVARPGLEVEPIAPDEVPTEVLAVDSPTLREAFEGFAGALRKEFAVTRCGLAAEEVDRHLLVDWSWSSEPVLEDRLQDWQGEALEIGHGGPALRPTAREHRGEAWFALDRTEMPDQSRAHVRILLPLASEA